MASAGAYIASRQFVNLELKAIHLSSSDEQSDSKLDSQNATEATRYVKAAKALKKKPAKTLKKLESSHLLKYSIFPPFLLNSEAFRALRPATACALKTPGETPLKSRLQGTAVALCLLKPEVFQLVLGKGSEATKIYKSSQNAMKIAYLHRLHGVEIVPEDRCGGIGHQGDRQARNPNP